MRVTENATEAIIGVMISKGLPIDTWALEICVLDNGALGMGFTRERQGLAIKFGELTVMIAKNVDSEDVVIDFGEVEGKQGLVFLSEEEYENNQQGEENVNNNNIDGESSEGS